MLRGDLYAKTADKHLIVPSCRVQRLHGIGLRVEWALVQPGSKSGQFAVCAEAVNASIGYVSGGLKENGRMIVVIEGISAAGKPTWCARHAEGLTVSEAGPLSGVPDRATDPKGAADFWAKVNARRWAEAIALESQHGIAVCDSDPLKLHYEWSLMRIGAASEAQFDLARLAMRRMMQARRLGFADRYFVQPIGPTAARKRRDGDGTRTRRNFDLHVQLQPALLAWYRRLEEVLPGAVAW